jgi:hypothetical protein
MQDDNPKQDESAISRIREQTLRLRNQLELLRLERTRDELSDASEYASDAGDGESRTDSSSLGD